METVTTTNQRGNDMNNVIKLFAMTYNNDFNDLFENDESIAESIVNWVDQANNEDYDARLEIVKASFPNFNY
jgi:hypothetical protein